MIRLYVKIPERFVLLILQDKFWVVHTPFVHMIKFKLLYYYLLIRVFTSSLMVFHWSWSDSKSPQVSRALLSILAVLNNIVV